MSYKKLEIWQLAKEVSVEIHRMTLEGLPKFEMFEQGSQIRRSSKSVKTNIVEGYGRRRYKHDRHGDSVHQGAREHGIVPHRR